MTCLEHTPETAENELTTNLNNLSYSLKTKDKQLFIDNISQLSKIIIDKQYSITDLTKEQRRRTFDSLSSIEIDFNDPLSLISNNSVLANNIDITDETLKLMMIGDEKAGKTYFIQKLLNYRMKEYTHTKSLEIYKKQIKLLGNYVRLELWDTNLSIIHSNLFGLYQKLSDSVILVINADKPSSAYFIYDLLSKIDKSLFCIDKNIFVLCNKREKVFQVNNSNSSYEQTYNVIQKIIKDIGIKVYFVDYDEIDELQNVVNKLISITYLKKGTGYLYNKGLNKSTKKNIKKQISTPEIPNIVKYSSDNNLNKRDYI